MQAIAYAKVKKKIWTITHERARAIFRDKLKPKISIEKKWPAITILATEIRPLQGAEGIPVQNRGE